MRFALLLFAAIAGFAQNYSELEKTVAEELKKTNSPGCTIAIVKGDSIVYRKAFGLASVDTGDAMRADMLFRLGSTTKMFTAATLVSLAHEGKLKLDEPIGKYVPGLPAVVARVTAAQLLSHTSGLADEAPMFGEQDESALGAKIRSFTSAAFFTEPGRVYSYSNPGYWTAGYVAEVLSGKLYADAVRERVFAPVGMKRSTFRPTEAITWPVAAGHEDGHVVRPTANNASGWPAGSMFSNVDDLSRFVIALMNDGVLEGKQVVPSSVVREMSSPHSTIPAESNYGYGLKIWEWGYHRMIGHAGSRSGYGSMIQMLPDSKVGIIILINRTGGALLRTMGEAIATQVKIGPVATPPPYPPHPDGDEAMRGDYQNGANKIHLEKWHGETWIPGPDGKPAYIFRGGRAYSRVN